MVFPLPLQSLWQLWRLRTRKELLQWGIAALQAVESAPLDAELLLTSSLQVSRTALRTGSEEPVSLQQKQRYLSAITARRSGTPVAYITGQKEWADMTLTITPAVLIPRPETEELCHIIVEEARDTPPRSVLDVGTGSGCVALFMARAYPQAVVTALDSSAAALAIARKNAQTQQLPLQMLHSDLLRKVARKTVYDLVIANLPYVPDDRPLSAEVEREPQSALRGGKGDGSGVMRRFLRQLVDWEIAWRECWLEFDPPQKDALFSYAESLGITECVFYKSLDDEWRFVRLQRTTPSLSIPSQTAGV